MTRSAQLDSLKPLLRRCIPSEKFRPCILNLWINSIYPTMTTAHKITYVNEKQFYQVVNAMLALATIVTIARGYVQARRRKPMESQDYLLFTGYILFLAMSVSTLLVSSKIFMIYKVQSHLIPPPITLKADIIWGVRMVNACNVLFLLSLWMVKLSFMALYRKLIKGLPGPYTQLWWMVIIFCLLVSPSLRESCLLLTWTLLIPSR